MLRYIALYFLIPNLFSSQLWHFSLFWALLVLCVKLSNLDFKGFLWAIWAHFQTTCRIFKILANCGVFSLFWALLVLCVKLSNLDFKGFLWSVWAHIQTSCTIFKILANCGVFSLFWAFLVLRVKLFNFRFQGVSLGLLGSYSYHVQVFRNSSQSQHFQLVLNNFSFVRKIIQF